MQISDPHMLLLIPLLPLAGFLVNAGIGRRLSKAASGGIAVGAMFLSFAGALAASRALLRLPEDARVIDQALYTWISSGNLDVTLGLRLDPLAMVMILVVTGIGALIHLYSTAYMHEETDAEYARYFSYLNLFAAFMLILVLAPNFAVMFVGWEGVGLCSYLLIGFWYKKQSAADAGKKAFIVNRIGDAGFLLGMALLFSRFGTLDFAQLAREIAPLAPETAAFGALSAAALLLFVGATGKSAQLPLYVWLPDAMEGPTPVSALIHAATMVTAGVYMIGRNAVLYTHAPGVLEIVAGVGVATALFAATIGLVQTDIKRVLAYSTVSQLGLMFLAMGVGAFGAGIFHLYTHAFFKALLFLGAGAVIHALAGEQDLRRMGGLRRDLPVTYWTFLIGALAIAGVPGFAGFFSKDEVLYRTFAAGYPLLWAAGAAASLLTAIYMFRLVFLAFHGEASDGRPQHGPHQHLHDAPPRMAVVLVALAAGAVLAGYVGVPAALGGSNRIEAFLEPSFHPAAEASVEGAVEGLSHEAHDTGLELGLMGVSTAVALGGIALAALFFLRRRDLADAWAARYRGMHRLLLHKYYVDELYDAAIVQPVKTGSEQVLWKGVDAGLIDGAVNGAGLTIRGASASLRRLQTGSLRSYAASLFVGVLLVLGYLLWP
ncbi:MAG TPA: NADH-quinone oxidoreductase subunit L [Vicinamibacterales bacterium]|nr:NADH-quinone oxidoreductase subunit L [Vicinamibacterales bacterium]